MHNPYQPGYAPAPRQGMAIASMIVGIVSFFSLGGLGVGAIVGIVLGIVALRKAGSNPKAFGGQGFAITGIVVSGCSLLTLPMIAAIAIPNLLAARRSANTASAIHTLRMIGSVQATYQSTFGQGRFGSAEDLFKEGLIDGRTANALGVRRMTSNGGEICEGTNMPKSGYKFRMTQSPSGFSVTAVVAVSEGVTRTGLMNFFIDETGVIRESKNLNQIPDADSEPLS